MKSIKYGLLFFVSLSLFNFISFEVSGLSAIGHIQSFFYPYMQLESNGLFLDLSGILNIFDVTQYQNGNPLEYEINKIFDQVFNSVYAILGI